jgi:hypothetical protein
LFDAMDEIMGFKDNVNPLLLINSATDFSSFETESPGQTPDETGEDDAFPDDIRTTAGTAGSARPLKTHARKLALPRRTQIQRLSRFCKKNGKRIKKRATWTWN